MTTPDGRFTIVFNGEVYNFVELRQELKSQGIQFRTKSDTEVVLQLFARSGPASVEFLRGMFAFAIFDKHENTVTLARDRLGKKPLYYYLTSEGHLLFASEIKALLPLMVAAGRELVVRPQAIYDYLSFGVVPQPGTIYRHVEALPPAHVARFMQGSHHELREYWKPRFEPKTPLTFSEAQDLVRAEIANAVAIRLRSDVPLGVFLSGGLDSSIIAHEAAQASSERLRTFTVATGGHLDEADVAGRTAARLGADHVVLPLTMDPVKAIHTVVEHYDQPYADSSAIPSMLISKLGREHVTVVLNGDGGDEVFGGYRRYVATRLVSTLDHLPRQLVATLLNHAGSSAQRRSRLGLIQRLARGAHLTHPERYIAWTTDLLREGDKGAWWKGVACEPSERLVNVSKHGNLGALDRFVAADLGLNLLSDLLVKMDMATMSVSLEGRSPFLDHHVVDLGLSLPAHYRVSGGTTKRILRAAYRGVLSDEVLHGSKKGFEVPLQSWLGGPLRPMVQDLLGSRRARVRQYIDDSALDRFIDGATLRDRNVSYMTYALLVLELWLARTHDGASFSLRDCA